MQFVIKQSGINCGLKTDTPAVIKCTYGLLFPLLGVFNAVVFSSCSKTYSLHAHLSVRSGGERGQVWLNVHCGDGGKPSLSSWLIPTGATVHSHCEMDLIAQMRVGWVGGGRHEDKKSDCYWPEAAGDRLPNICKNGSGAHLLIMVIACS